MLRNVRAIVSGGSSGLGAAAASHIVKNGGKVVVADLKASEENFWNMNRMLEEIVTPSQSYSSNNTQPCASSFSTSQVLAFSETDVTNADQVSRALDMAEDVFGKPVNAAISCAGIGVAKKTISKARENTEVNRLYQAHPPELFWEALDVNVVGTFNVARLAAERMASQEPEGGGQDTLRGCIINTASIAAYEGQIGQVAYATSKAAIVGMTLPMARDLASHGIRVMTIAPGLFRTPLLDGLPSTVEEELGASVPLPSRLGDPEEFGLLVGTILTNPMLNGSVIRLDGALRMPP
ncbi:3-hydroxyacyl-coenzyme A dehydrogenase [Nitzschia inconspicua]|uniref:3-hydroxyacyl-coenzyme A dehydrogenase n=1 Tax=Nitzschia inconspicua TaxID=303405 RepID=A0A9K3PVW7_9STRA|nr:3-hydroxyacyl-coenzyme A dehydrogenase [Nitzschia inconspicua]